MPEASEAAFPRYPQPKVSEAGRHGWRSAYRTGQRPKPEEGRRVQRAEQPPPTPAACLVSTNQAVGLNQFDKTCFQYSYSITMASVSSSQ